MSQPQELVQAQFGLWQDHARLWQAATQRMLGMEVEPVIDADAWRPAVQGRRLGRQRAVRLHQAVLPAELEVPPAGRRPKGRPGRQDPAEARVLRAPVRRDDGAVELPGDQPRSPAPDDRDPRREPAARPEEHAGGPRPRQGPARDQDDRSRRVRGRPEHRHDPGQGRVPDRADAADPVCAIDRGGAPAAVDDHAAVDQQVLHPRPAAQEQLHQVLRRPGLHDVRPVLGQPGREAQPHERSRTTCSWARWRRWTRSRGRPASAR